MDSRAPLVVILLLALGLGGWLTLDAQRQSRAAAELEARVLATEVAARAELSAVESRADGATEAPRRAAPTDVGDGSAAPVGESPAAVERDDAPAGGGGFERALQVHFRDRDRESVTLAEGVVTVTAVDPPADRVARAPFSLASQVDAGRFATGTYRVELEGAAVRSLPVEVTVERGDGDDDPVEVDLHVWSRAELPVVVRGEGEQSLTELAAGLGCEPHQIWSGTFDVRLRLDHWAEAGEAEALGSYRPAPGHKQWHYAGDVIGTLVLERDPPLWAELRCMGAVVAEELVRPDADELRFTLDRAAVEARMARLELTAVDCLTGDPLAGARVTLKAEGSTYRRAEHHGLATDDQGHLALERIVPEQYELTVETDVALHQRWITFEPGQDLDLGSIELGCGAGDPLVVRVVEGPPEWRHAFVEIAPFDDSRSVEDVYPGNLHRGIGPGEDHELPMPEQRSILRVQIPWHYGPQGAGADPYFGGSATWHGMCDNIVIDPESRPVGPIEVRLRPVVDVDVLIDVEDVAGLRVLDDNGLHLGRIRRRGTTDGREHWVISVTQGTYTLVVVDSAGAERLRRRTTFDGEGPLELP